MRQKRRLILDIVFALGLLLGSLPAAQAFAQSGAVPVAPPIGSPVAVTTTALNLRSGPGTAYSVLNTLSQGQSIAIIGRDASGQWYEVELADGTIGWVAAAYLPAGTDVSTVPEAAAPAPPAPAASGQAARPAAQQAHIMVFQVSSGGPIYVVNPDGTGLRYLTNGLDPALSPDGKTVAFTRWSGSSNGDYGDLWVINVDGTGERKVLSFINQPKSPTWSPDGTQIAISMQQGGNVNPKRETITVTPGSHPSIPRGAYDIVVNGNQISFTVPSNPDWGLRMVNVATGAFQDLPRDTNSYAPTWDPADPNRIVFQGDQGLKNTGPNQTGTTQLTTDVDQWAPVFSPDGSKIAVSYRQNNNWEVHVLNADGSGDTRLTQTPDTVLVNEQIQGQQATPWNNAAPAWSPDGSQIAFVTDRAGHWEIWVMNADGSNQHPLFAQSVQDSLNIQYQGVDERVISWR